jgi:hypothetical protein
MGNLKKLKTNRIPAFKVMSQEYLTSLQPHIDSLK